MEEREWICMHLLNQMTSNKHEQCATCVSQNVYGLYEEVLMAALKSDDLSKRLNAQFKAKV